MKLNEYWNVQKLKFLVELALFILVHDELKSSSKKDQSSAKARLTMLRNTLKEIDSKGNLIVEYKPSPNTPKGRMYSNPRGYQGAAKWVRSYVGADDHYWDIDIVNAHPSILLSLCERHDFSPESYSMLERYVKEKDLVVEEEVKAGNQANIVKSSYLIALNSGNPENTHKDFIPTLTFLEYRKQINEITTKLQKLYPTINNKKTDNTRGSFMSLLLQQEENTILTKKIKPFLTKHKLKVAALMFDGCMVYKKSGVDIDKILCEFTEDIREPILPSYIRLARKTFYIPGVEEVVAKYVRYNKLIRCEIQDKHVDFIWEHFKENNVIIPNANFYYEFVEGKGWEKTSHDNLKRVVPALFLKYYEAMEKALENLKMENMRKKDEEKTEEEREREEKNEKKRKDIRNMIKCCTLSRFRGTIECFIGYKPYIDQEFENKLNNTNIHRFFPLMGGKVLDFERREIIPTKKEHYFSIFSPAKKLGDRNKIEEYIKQVQPNDKIRKFFRTHMGTTIMGMKPDRKMYIWIGEGRNGKTKIAEMLIAISPFTIPLQTNALSGPKNRYQAAENSHTSHLNNLRGARCAIVTEPEEGDQLKEGIVKKLTGGDTIPIRRLHKEEERLTPTCRIIYLTNNILKYKAEKAMKDRIRYIPFGQSFEDHPDPKNPRHSQKDDEKVEEISVSYDDFLDFLLWGIETYQDEGGLIEPEEIRNFTVVNQNTSDSVTAFMMDFLESEKNNTIKLEELYQRFIKEDPEGSKGILKKPFAKRVREYIGDPHSIRYSGGTATLFDYKFREDT